MEICMDCGADEGSDHDFGCANEGERCPICARDFEGCECEDGIGHDSFV